MLPHPVLDRAPGDETSQSPPRETDFVIEPMEVDESDGEDQGVVFPMDTRGGFKFGQWAVRKQ